jgi:hypothetical protein
VTSSVSDPTSAIRFVHCRVNESWRGVRKPQVSAAPSERMSRPLLKFGDGPGASYAAVVTVTSST